MCGINRHIGEVTLKGNKKLQLIRRLCKDIVDTHTKNFSTVPSSEYGSEVWSPYTMKLKMQIENIQRRATKFTLRYPKDTNYKQSLIRFCRCCRSSIEEKWPTQYFYLTQGLVPLTLITPDSFSHHRTTGVIKPGTPVPITTKLCSPSTII